MRVLAFRYTDHVPAMRTFLEALGLRTALASQAGGYVQLDGSGGTTALHSAAGADTPRRAGDTEISFESEEPLEAVRDRLAAIGTPADIVDEAFGRSLRVTDPDGVDLQVNEAMTDLHGYAQAQPGTGASAV